MGYVFTFNDAKLYEQWHRQPHNRAVAALENRLMHSMLNPVEGKTILDIGCGIGIGARSFLDAGLHVTGIDPSPYMLDIARNYTGNRVHYHRGFAEDLPFGDNEFNFSSMVTTLEFVEDPQKALAEVFRVTKDKVFLGVLNRYAIKGIQRRVKGMFTQTIYNRARFFSIWELKHIIRSTLGDAPIFWRTVCQLPAPSGELVNRMEHSRLIQKSPFGAFVGIVVIPLPRFRTRPLSLKYFTKRHQEIPNGC